MIRHNKSINVEYQQIKMNKLFGLDRKSQFKMNNLFAFYLLMLNSAKHVKMAQKLPKMSLNAHYLTVFDSILYK